MSEATAVCLVATCHDPAGRFVAGIESALDFLAESFCAIAVNATSETSRETVDALSALGPTLAMQTHPAGSIGIGTARRDALALGLAADSSHLMYSDLDHLLRWAVVAPGELKEVLAHAGDAELTVIGRQRHVFEREPMRLQLTEGAVNQAASIALGLTAGDVWDFMIACRLMSHETARLMVDECSESTIGNDVAWPLHARQQGCSIAYRPVSGLEYRFRDDFGTAADSRDLDAREWVRRMEIAAVHAQAMRPYLA